MSKKKGKAKNRFAVLTKVYFIIYLIPCFIATLIGLIGVLSGLQDGNTETIIFASIFGAVFALLIALCFIGLIAFNGKKWANWYAVIMRLIFSSMFCLVFSAMGNHKYQSLNYLILFIGPLVTSCFGIKFMKKYGYIIALAWMYIVGTILAITGGEMRGFLQGLVVPLIFTIICIGVSLPVILDGFKISERRPVDNATDPYRALEILAEDYKFGFISEEEYKKDREFFLSKI